MQAQLQAQVNGKISILALASLRLLLFSPSAVVLPAFFIYCIDRKIYETIPLQFPRCFTFHFSTSKTMLYSLNIQIFSLNVCEILRSLYM